MMHDGLAMIWWKGLLLLVHSEHRVRLACNRHRKPGVLRVSNIQVQGGGLHLAQPFLQTRQVCWPTGNREKQLEIVIVALWYVGK